MKRRGFVHGAMLLAGAAMLSKLLGSVYTIFLQNIIGDHGMGLFQMAYPVYSTLLAVATAGFPVAVSKLVAEELAQGHTQAARRTYQISAFFLCVLGVFAFLVLYIFAHTWAKIAGDPSATLAIRAISPALLIVPLLSAMRGYLQGHEWMEPTAVSQVMEQLVRVITILALSIYFMQAGFGAATAAAGAAFGAVTGAAAGLLTMMFYRRRQPVSKMSDRHQIPWSRLLRRLIYYALPISLGALVIPLMNNVDALTVVHLLKQAGETQREATSAFGLLAGRAAKLTLLPITLASGIGIAVMPAVSAAAARQDMRSVRNHVQVSLRMTAILALPATVGLVLLARPVDIVLFQNSDGWNVIAWLSLSILFASLQTTAAAVLQGAGMVYLPVIHLLAAACLKVVLNLLWIRQHGLVGAVWSTDIAYLFACLLNLLAISRRLGGLSLSDFGFLPIGVSAFVMGAVEFALVRAWPLLQSDTESRWTVSLALMAAIVLGVLAFSIAAVASNALQEEEIERIPKVGPRLLSIFSRMGLTRS
ncbi:putative polysaccharide biosynthesis protein [Alicyclobacillus tolerans]|uniref:Stage V sporulation protein B n=2 Tax=Alicyclobacillus tolerans TaxID=90970 RepID=A0A1M6PG48_9BACL|nr:MULTISPECIES: polysaccharide biosynthesis protein [Alicyclobacillus]MDP9729754.1 O-antigen/teichoic acid export membrane protein [Alicyclobacillus tengchongensis]QRF22356.1 polysaccharide biosynthesis protein [Alicyclobacillus sp. TC]SHK06929.1 stage V sporulation protein B [Alicyclobacillus montanus]